jgi:hypothetical protein
MTHAGDRRQWPLSDPHLIANLWIGKQLRRYHASHPDGLAQYRSSRAWLKIIEWQTSGERKPDNLGCHVAAFLQQGMPVGGPPWYNFKGPNKLGSQNPWAIQTRQGGDQLINRVPSPEADLEFQLDTREKEWLLQDERWQAKHRPLNITDPNEFDLSML